MKKILFSVLFGIFILCMVSCSDSAKEELDDLIEQIDNAVITKESFYGKWSLVEYERYEIENGQYKKTYWFTEPEGAIIFEFRPNEIISYEVDKMHDTKVIDWRYDSERRLIVGTYSEYDDYNDKWVTYGVDDADYIYVKEFTGSDMVLEVTDIYGEFYSKRVFKKLND